MVSNECYGLDGTLFGSGWDRLDLLTHGLSKAIVKRGGISCSSSFGDIERSFDLCYSYKLTCLIREMILLPTVDRIRCDRDACSNYIWTVRAHALFCSRTSCFLR